MDSDTLVGALALVGVVGGFGLLGALIGRDVARNTAHGRDNWHRPGGYPVDPALPDRLYDTLPAASLSPTADPATATAGLDDNAPVPGAGGGYTAQGIRDTTRRPDLAENEHATDTRWSGSTSSETT
ncbi:hypothetical protein ACFVYP_40785 [Kitasatospora sp. NPDC058201]|uniref:hypothetical protein n=1 Tax=unclassified Kitasatospora TaxID=2633591 RepID=UPI00364D75D0